MDLVENREQVDTKLQPFIELLKSNYNLILTGAPGTGKTYLAKQIAKAMGAETEFVQFHPSYDYTDFVEGLRPKSDANGNIGFERRDGVFKAFCKKAIPFSKKNKDWFKCAYIQFVDNIDNETIAQKHKQKKKVKLNDGIIYPVPDEDGKKYPVHFDTLEYLSKSYKTKKELQDTPIKEGITERLKNAPNVHQAQAPSDVWAVLMRLYEIAEEQKAEEKDFVFIIDEINRGDISKVLGELFFSIDPGYRGKTGMVQTQYQNMIGKEVDVFDDGFYVPENVYIIGTMNDIDRSVESMDFAMRRRFAWKEITAESQIDMLNKLGDKKKNAINRMNSLNKTIQGIEGLGAAYHIGPAYFLKLNMYKDEGDGGWNSLWENHIEGVLREYLRGNEDIDKLMADLRNAYDNEKGQKDAPAQGNNEGEGSEAVTEKEE